MRTVLFGWDGATYTVLDALVKQGLMPNLAVVYRQGARSILESTALPLTPQAWTSMATSRTAGNHGLHDFIRPEITAESVYFHVNDSRDNRCDTIWKYASRQGQRVTVLNYFGMAPPEPINGHIMPGFTSGRHLRRSSFPPDLFEQLQAVENLDVKLLGLDLDVERLALQDMPREQWRDWIEHHLAREKVWFNILEHLMLEEPSELTALVLDGVDKIQHLAYRFLDPSLIPAKPDPWEAEMIELCQSYFRQVDDFLGRLLQLVEPEGRVFIASDHGFTASTEMLYINKWLHDQGWLQWREQLAPDEMHATFSPRLSDLADAIDLPNTKAFALMPSCNGIYINVPAEEYTAFREELIARLSALRGPTGELVVHAIKKREEHFRGPFMQRIPDLTLALRDCGFISVLNSREAVTPRPEPVGTHHPDGVFMAIGPGIRAGANVGRLGILDVAPALLYSLGLAIPSDVEGKFPDQLFQSELLALEPPRRVDVDRPEDAPLPVSQGAALSAEDEAILVDRLRGLGYL